MKTIDDLGELRGKRVLVRSDLNVPLDGTRITALGPVTDWLGLDFLRVARTPLQSLAGIETVLGVDQIDISDTQVDDISVLLTIMAFRKNDRLDARGAPLDGGDCDDIRALRERGVTVLADPECE